MGAREYAAKGMNRFFVGLEGGAHTKKSIIQLSGLFRSCSSSDTNLCDELRLLELPVDERYIAILVDFRTP